MYLRKPNAKIRWIINKLVRIPVITTILKWPEGSETQICDHKKIYRSKFISMAQLRFSKYKHKQQQ